MKINFRTVLDNLLVIIVRNPVEILISMAFFILSVLSYEHIMDMKIYSENLFLAPLIFANAFLLNKFYPRGYKRVIYQIVEPSDSLLYLDLNNYRIVFGEIKFNKEQKASTAHIKALLIK